MPRITKVVTKTGDAGYTGLGDKDRISKSSPRINAIGDIDELNSVVGWVLIYLTTECIGYSTLQRVQHDLLNIGGELCVPGLDVIEQKEVDILDQEIEQLSDMLPPLTNFVIPGGTELVARLHMARTVCRRAERSIVKVQTLQYINPYTMMYINRLSDYFFILARIHSQTEIIWDQKQIELELS